MTTGSRFKATDREWAPTRWTGEFATLLLDAVDRRVDQRSPGKRPFHQHGFVMTGEFLPSENDATVALLQSLTDFKPFVTENAKTPVIARISHLADHFDEPGVVGLATKFVPKGEEISDFLALSADIFPVARSRDFADLLDAQARRVRGFPKIAAMLVTRRLRVGNLLDQLKADRVNHGNGLGTTFHGLQTFRLVGNGHREKEPVRSTPMRYRWEPAEQNPADTYKDFKAKLDKGFPEVRFHLDLLLRPLGGPATGAQEDRIDDPRYRWPEKSRVIRAGTMTLNKIISEEDGGLNFNPAVLAPGIQMGDSELFSSRQGAYAKSFIRRAKEARSIR